MLQFIQKFSESATCILNGFDRIVFRGYLRALMYPEGMKRHLSYQDVPRRDFGKHVERTTQLVKQASLREAVHLERPTVYLRSSQIRKEDVAKKILAQSPVSSGLICVLSCVEPCMTYEMYRNRDAHKLELVYRPRKCLHLYHYYLDPLFGFMHARIQTWYPFCIQVCMNGREYLARRMDEAGLHYTRHENSFIQLADPWRAQQMMDEFLRLDWARHLNQIAARLNPEHGKNIGPCAYYWSAHQTEWATDILFDSPARLQSIYPRLVWGAITTFSTRDVMRFLGKQLQPHFKGEVVSQYQQRAEGLRIKHSVNANSVKMYDKGGRILRVETTLNDPRQIKVYRPAEQGARSKKTMRPRILRKGVADLERRAQVCQRANERYLNALSQLNTDLSLYKLLEPVTKQIRRQGKRYRGLRPCPRGDLQLLEAINRPDYLLCGFRNRDIMAILYPSLGTDRRARQAASGRIAYRLRILLAHGLIAKIRHTRAYRITPTGQTICTATLLAQHATVQQLSEIAA